MKSFDLVLLFYIIGIISVYTQSDQPIVQNQKTLAEEDDGLLCEDHCSSHVDPTTDPLTSRFHALFRRDVGNEIPPEILPGRSGWYRHTDGSITT